MQKWTLLRNRCEKWVASGRVAEEHTEDEHRYRDTKTGVLYTESATRVIEITNTEGYAQRNARSIIAQIRGEYRTYTDDNVDGLLCAALHVSSEKLEANALGTEVHRLLDLWCSYIIEQIKLSGMLDCTFTGDIKSFVNANSARFMGEATVDLRVMSACLAFEEWRVKNKVYPIATEIALIVKKYETAGKIDLLCLYGEAGLVTLVDYKTGVLKKSHWLQQAVYAKGLRDCLHITLDQVMLWQPSMKNLLSKEVIIAPMARVTKILDGVVKAHQLLTTLKDL